MNVSLDETRKGVNLDGLLWVYFGVCLFGFGFFITFKGALQGKDLDRGWRMMGLAAVLFLGSIASTVIGFFWAFVK